MYRRIVAISALWALLSVLLQVILYPSQENIILSLQCLTGTAVTLIYFCNRSIPREYPLSSISIIGFTGYYFFLPPFVSLIEHQPASSNLTNSSQVGLHAIVAIVSLLLAHILYRYFCRSLVKFTSSILHQYTPTFSKLTHRQIIFMGLIGFVCGFAQLTASTAIQGVYQAILHGLVAYSFFPLITFTASAFVGVSKPGKVDYVRVGLLTPLLIGYGIIRNSRSAIFVGGASFLIVKIWTIVFQKHTIRLRLIPIGSIILLVAVIAKPSADLATAMVIARSGRSEASVSEQLIRTIDVFNDKNALARFKDSDSLELDPLLDEKYVSNVFLARLCNLRFLDISLQLCRTMESEQKWQYAQIEFQRVASILPSPILNFFGIKVDKAFVMSGSSGDFLAHIATPRLDVVGGFRTGSLIGSCFVVFGWFYPIAIAIGAVPTFVIMDSFCLHFEGTPKIAPLGFLLAFRFCVHWTSAALGCEGLSSLVLFLFRGWLQEVVLYGLLYLLTHYSLQFVTKTNRGLEIGSV